MTIGIGRNLDDRGISQTEAYVRLENDIRNCEKQLLDEIPEINNKLDEVRQSVLINMCFNLGIKGLLGFNNSFYEQKKSQGRFIRSLIPTSTDWKELIRSGWQYLHFLHRR